MLFSPNGQRLFIGPALSLLVPQAEGLFHLHPERFYAD